jgi:hypothetical protein
VSKVGVLSVGLCPYLCVSGSEGFWLGGGFLALVSLSLLVGLLSSLGIMGCCILCCVVLCCKLYLKRRWCKDDTPLPLLLV